MLRLRNGLVGLLALQLVLLVVLWPRERSNDSSEAALIALAPAAVEQLRITDGEGNSVAVGRADDGWRLLGPDLPARSSRINSLLSTLLEDERGWPVATSAAALQRFSVTPEQFERRIDFTAGGGEQTLYLGTAPGFRQVHARPAESDAVYVLRFNAFDAPAGLDDWLDQSLLQIAEPRAVSGTDYVLRRHGETWRTDAGESPDDGAVQELLRGLSNIRANRIAAEEARAALSTTEASATLTVETAGATLLLTLHKLGDAHIATRSDYAGHAFEISGFDHDRLVKVARANLFPPPDTTDDDIELDPEALEDAWSDEDGVSPVPQAIRPQSHREP